MKIKFYDEAFSIEEKEYIQEQLNSDVEFKNEFIKEQLYSSYYKEYIGRVNNKNVDIVLIDGRIYDCWLPGLIDNNNNN